MLITITTDKVMAQWADKLHSFAGATLQRELARGLNAGGDKARTQVRQALRIQMGVRRYGAVTERTRAKPASAGNLQYTIIGIGGGLPIKEFPHKAKGAADAAIRYSRRDHWRVQTRQSGGQWGAMTPSNASVTASPWGVTRTFARSFVDADGVPKSLRSTGQKQRLFGPGVAQEMMRGQSIAAFDRVGAMVLETISDRVMRMLA